ncbi:AEC family transporter [Sphingobium sp. HWE2-09]|uniref:AEC family transporter n=1 Tax=Sphingobium sp. HWE2-09 TaxID=3108390 RepID=UPI002DCC0283|nr:AEC family transporter [Sphingobium sp. HWE2-09]
MAMTIFGALVPVFGLILLGYFCGRTNILGDRAFEVLNRFVIAVTLPVLTFRSIARMDPHDLAQPWMMIAVVGGALATYAIGFAIEKALGRSGGEANIAGLCACFSNTGFVGLPIALLTFGKGVIAPVAVTMLLYSSVVFTIGVVMSEMAANHGHGAKAGLKLAGRSVLRNPLILLSSLGVVWCLLRVPLDGPFDVLLSTLAQATAPCALTAIGIFIALPREKAAPGPIGRALLLKLGVHPVLTAGFILILPPMPTLWAKMAILMAAMPSGASSFVLAGKAGRWAMELSAWAVTLTTTLASVSLIAILWWLGA